MNNNMNPPNNQQFVGNQKSTSDQEIINKRMNKIIKLDDLYIFIQNLHLINNNLEHRFYEKLVEDNVTLFNRCCRYGSINIIKYLTQNGIIIDKQKGSSWLFDLLISVKYQKCEVVKLLLDHAKDNDCLDISRLRIAFHTSIFIKNYDMTNLLLNYGINPDIPDELGNTALHVASQSDVSMTKLIIAHSTAVSINATNNENWTPLRQAVTNKKYEIAEILLQHGAVDNIIDNKGKTAYDYANLFENIKIVKLLDRYRIINQLTGKLVTLLILSRKLMPDSVFHEDYLCHDLFKVIIGCVKSEIRYKGFIG